MDQIQGQRSIPNLLITRQMIIEMQGDCTAMPCKVLMTCSPKPNLRRTRPLEASKIISFRINSQLPTMLHLMMTFQLDSPEERGCPQTPRSRRRLQIIKLLLPLISSTSAGKSNNRSLNRDRKEVNLNIKTKTLRN